MRSKRDELYRECKLAVKPVINQQNLTLEALEALEVVNFTTAVVHVDPHYSTSIIGHTVDLLTIVFVAV